jgi:hypothetical protein
MLRPVGRVLTRSPRMNRDEPAVSKAPEPPSAGGPRVSISTPSNLQMALVYSRRLSLRATDFPPESPSL